MGKRKPVWSCKEVLTLVQWHASFKDNWREYRKFLPGRSHNAIQCKWKHLEEKGFCDEEAPERPDEETHEVEVPFFIQKDQMGKEWSKDELAILRACHERFDDHWEKYEEFLPGRTYFAIKNRWQRLKRDPWRDLFDNTTFGPDEGEIIDNIMSW
jgi:hypothetical protein